jgi:hypothetical protein
MKTLSPHQIGVTSFSSWSSSASTSTSSSSSTLTVSSGMAPLLRSYVDAHTDDVTCVRFTTCGKTTVLPSPSYRGHATNAVPSALVDVAVAVAVAAIIGGGLPLATSFVLHAIVLPDDGGTSSGSALPPPTSSSSSSPSLPP